MARKVLGVKNPVEEVRQEPANQLQNKLIQLIPAYGANKSKADELKALIEADNKRMQKRH